MKKIGRRMSLLMSVALSFTLSLVGTVSSGHFTLPSFLLSFVISAIVSLLIGLLVPMPKLYAAVGRKFGLQRGALSTRLVEALLSDLVYTPLMTFLMVGFAWLMTKRSGAAPPFLTMFLPSLLMSLAVAYVLIFLVTPPFMKLASKGIVPPGVPPKE